MEASEIMAAVDATEYISQYVELEEKGGQLWGLSPFNEEKTPSFSLDEERGLWYDFSAGFGGNLLEFVMRYKKLSLPEAVGELKKYAKIEDQIGEVPARLQATNVARRYRNNTKPPTVMTAKPLPSDCMEMYEWDLGKMKPWLDEGITTEALRRFGVRYDAFDDRIVFPIRDYSGNIISICGRTCAPDFKERKIRKYTYFQKVGTIDTIYNFSDSRDEIFRSGEIILFEGAKSCMKMYGWGFRNACAILTSHLSENQFRFLIQLASYHNVRIVFALDSDVNIREDKTIMKLTSYARTQWVKNRNDWLAPKESPVDRGQGVWQRLYNMREELRRF